MDAHDDCLDFEMKPLDELLQMQDFSDIGNHQLMCFVHVLDVFINGVVDSALLLVSCTEKALEGVLVDGVEWVIVLVLLGQRLSLLLLLDGFSPPLLQLLFSVVISNALHQLSYARVVQVSAGLLCLLLGLFIGIQQLLFHCFVFPVRVI